MNDRTTGLRTAREETIDALCRLFADDALSLGELERRLDRARVAQSRRELDALLADLQAPAAAPPAPTGQGREVAGGGSPAGERPAPESRPGRTVDGSGVRDSSHVAIAILGGTRRAGRWAPPSEMVVAAIMGGVNLDFRDALLKPGVTEINCFALWGGVDITVPPDVNVETQGFALLGGFDQESALEVDPAPDAPVIRVTGFALMGGVAIKVRDRGEVAPGQSVAVPRREARHDRLLERREERLERLRQRGHRRDDW